MWIDDIYDDHRKLLTQKLKGQMSSAEMWMKQHQRFQDESSFKNALFAVGRLQGLYDALLGICGVDDVPSEIVTQMSNFENTYDELRLRQLSRVD